MEILCFGDSNTYGYDPRGFGGRYDPEDRWVDLAAKQSGHTLINAGVNGMEIPRCWDPRLLPAQGPVDRFLVMLGTNDLLQGASAQDTAKRMERFLQWASPLFLRTVLVSPPPMKRGAWVPSEELVQESQRLTEEYKTVAEKLGIPFINTSQWKIALAFDGVHFTQDGHRSFAKHIAEYLDKQEPCV